MAPKKNRPEQAIQRAVVQYLGIMENLGELFYYAVPNGGLRSKIEASIFKSLGVRAGVSDIVVMFPGGKCAFIEIKSAKGRLSEAQQRFKNQVEHFGFEYAECRSVTEVEAFVRRLIANPEQRKGAA